MSNATHKHTHAPKQRIYVNIGLEREIHTYNCHIQPNKNEHEKKKEKFKDSVFVRRRDVNEYERKRRKIE